MKLLIVGGVAGGASAAARARRLSEDAEIILFERGDYVSFANCGLPYHIGKTIPERDSLLVMTPEKLKGRSNIDVRIKNEVLEIDRKNKVLKVKDLNTGKEYTESYDKLILSPGSSPVIPPIPGASDPDVMVLWTINDMDRIIRKIDSGIKTAAVIGGGFIGLEVAENLIQIGIKTSLVEMLPHVMPPLDPEMARPIEDTLTENGVDLYLGDGVTEISKKDGRFTLKLKSGGSLEADMVIMSAGIRPNSELAKGAGLKLNKRGGVIVNHHLQTDDSDIYAVGDVIEVNDISLNVPTMIPLAGPANKQGRIAADNVFGKKSIYRGSLGTSICKVFEKTAASVGSNEKKLKMEGIDYQKFYMAPPSHASYYPGGYTMITKVIFNKKGRILGAQITGDDGVDKRIDVFATAIRNKLTFDDLEELELAYAPPYGSAKDPINFAGYIGNNILEGKTDVVSPDEIKEDDYLLDVREKDEVLCGAIPGANHILLDDLRTKSDTLPKDKEIIVYCKSGSRGYIAELILRKKGFRVKNLSGGYEIWRQFQESNSKCEVPVVKNASKVEEEVKEMAIDVDNIKITTSIDACGLQCPGPIVKVKQNLEKLNDGEILQVKVSDKGFMKDLPAWCESTGNTLLDLTAKGSNIEAIIQKGTGKQLSVKTTEVNGEKRTSMVMFSNDLDKALATMIIASGFATLGHKVTIFFTFWGINVLRKDNPPKVKKDLLSKMFGFMMPRGARKLALSKMHMLGMGTGMMKHVMKSKNIESLPNLIKQAQDLGVKFLVCEMAMNMMGIQEEELIDGIETAGVANFAALSEKSITTLFI